MSKPETLSASYKRQQKESQDGIAQKQEAIKQQTAEKEKLVKELAKLRHLLEQVEESGVSSVDLPEKVQAKEEEIRQIDRACREATAEIAKHEATLKDLEASLWLVDYAERILNAEIPEIPSPSALFDKAVLTISTADGVPTKINAGFRVEGGRALDYQLAIDGAPTRILKGFLPTELRWLPAEWLAVQSPPSINYHNNTCVIGDSNRPAHANYLNRIYAIENENRLMPTVGTFGWRTENPYYQRYGYNNSEKEWLNYERDVSATHRPFQQVLDAEFEAEGNKLDFGKVYRAGSFLGHIQRKMLSATIPLTEHEFERVDEPLATEVIEKELGEYWTAFVRCPWLPNLNGLLANFKYYCENRERPRFYSLTLKGSYGFRLRTRDHSWILGRIYLLPGSSGDAQASSPRLEITESDYNKLGVRFRLGRMCGRIVGEERAPH